MFHYLCSLSQSLNYTCKTVLILLIIHNAALLKFNDNGTQSLFVPSHYTRTFSNGRSSKVQPLESSDSRITYIAEERYYKMITEKHSYVDKLINEHSKFDDKLQLRLNFLQCTQNHKLSEMLRRNSDESSHKLSVIADMKRRTPTHNPKCDDKVLSYIDAGEVALNMASAGFDVIFVNTDEIVYGGHVQDLHKSFLELRKLGRRKRPAIVMKDIFLHPIQIAQATEYRADGVLLNASILGNALENMLNACINMGTEAIVEVHDATEALRATDIGARILLVNQWDRVKNILKPTRALDIKDVIPEDVTTIACGGIMTIKQAHELALAGYDAVCFGRRLIYPDVPEFIKQVKDWKAPCKPILKMSKRMFFDYKTVNGVTEISLKENHLELLDEMNHFYFSERNDELISEIKKLSKKNIDESTNFTEQNLTPGEKSREITVNIGVPTSSDALIKVGTLAVSPEGQKEYIDQNREIAKLTIDRYRLKWFIEKKKWIKNNLHLYNNEEEAECAYDLKKGIEMYNQFKFKGKEYYPEVMSPEEIKETERVLFQNVQELYEKAPKINGKINLNFDEISSPPPILPTK
ncbi:hypothetical protein BEWA_019770 [Theileria equi strain WA]|uniref:indole-3-glycerol-phosphate synthase n=1 Tax=Theileria equi strain WA TaxID=1537102 RepID=L0AVS7_THEEQ|nr:hypothetical protein BEWA_019770 [Theileria equi strain WA]AFZ79131.1 hypothetical protein BEWA_019770 [Theileria equi strain WA]|eukprot:XP_004828797.1 hypothetical protein BEWA_019770 [Theileria equi strain WA]